MLGGHRSFVVCVVDIQGAVLVGAVKIKDCVDAGAGDDAGFRSKRWEGVKAESCPLLTDPAIHSTAGHAVAILMLKNVILNKPSEKSLKTQAFVVTLNKAVWFH